MTRLAERIRRARCGPFQRRTKAFKLARCGLALCLSLSGVIPLFSAEIRPVLTLRLSTGRPTVVLSGSPGAVYLVQSATDLSSPNPWADRTLLQAQATNQVWSDLFSFSTNTQFYRAVFLPAPANSNLVFIEPGTFTMGSPPTEQDRSAEESPQTVVTLTHGFWMEKYPVTQAEYLATIGSNPSYFTADNGFPQDLTRPVEQVRWEDATNFCAILNQQELAAGRIPTNCMYRLPTEAEYEYAHRAGTTTRFSYGDDPAYSSLTNHEWFGDNGAGMSQPVGLKLPNPWGLYDMGGNVAAWCHDWHAPLPGGKAVDPQGPATGVYNQSGPGSFPFHVCRGTGWDGGPWSCRCAFRSYYDDGSGDVTLGIRIVLALKQ